MKQRTARIVSRALVGLTLIVCGAAFVVGATTFSRQQPGQIVVIGEPTIADAPEVLRDLRERSAAGDTFAAALGNPGNLIALTVSLLWLGTGVAIAGRQPRNTAGWIFIAIGIAWPVATLASVLVLKGVKVDPGSIPLLDVWAVIQEHTLYPLALVPLLFLLFPNGKPPSPRWRWAERLLFVGLAITVVGFVFDPGPLNNLVDTGILYMNPIGVRALAGVSAPVTALGATLAVVASLSTVLAVRGRYRRSQGEERQQMRWLVFVATIAGALFTFEFAGFFVLEALGRAQDESFNWLFDTVFGLLALVLALGIPAAYMVAILRYRLWDLDVVIKKTAVALILALLIGGLFLALVGGFAAVSLGIGERTSAAIIAFALGVLIWPLRNLARRFADRVVYGKRSTPYEVLSSFSERVGGTYATEDVLPRMAQVLATGIGANKARVWLRVGDVLRQEAAWPPDTVAADPVHLSAETLPTFDGDVAVEVRYQGELLGAVTATVPANDPMNPTKDQLVRDLAAQAGLVLRNVHLIEDLRDSRRRLVTAQDEERRRLERNIHDGAQQQLVALAVKLRLAEHLAVREPEKSKAMLAQLQTQTHETLEDLRDLARGIYPPLLADKGLAVALEAQARKSTVPVTVRPEGLGRYPQAVEAAVYFSCLEALQNVSKYAGASHATVELSDGVGTLSFAVRDDGRGFDPAATGSGTGLQGIADRLAALGGTLHVDSSPGAGTEVRGHVPVEGLP
jgi:signal transduction histidine kinase